MGLDICHIKLDKKNDQNVDYLETRDFDGNVEFLERHAHLVVDGKVYYREIDCLRKHVIENFVKRFDNEKLYFKLADVMKAKEYLKAKDNENQNELEESFQTNFIDNFVEGESIFFISY